MMKRRLTIFFVAIMALCLLFAVGCSEKAPPAEIYTVALDANGGRFDDGDTLKSYKVTSGDMLQVPRPTRADYDFTGWYSDVNVESSRYDFSAKPITYGGKYYAGWAPNAFAVTFMYNYEGAPSGGVYRTDKVAKNGTVTQPADPDRDGYIFTKWTSDPGGNDAWSFSTDTVSSPVSLYAQWEKEEAVTSLTVTAQPTKTSYIAGESFDPTGMVVKAMYESGKSVEITNYTLEYDFSSPNAEAVVKIKFAGKETSVTVTVIAREVESVTFTGKLGKSFAVGDSFDTTGLTFTATYNDGKSGTLDNADITYSSPSLDGEGKFTVAGDAVITFMYGNITVTPTLTVTVAEESDELVSFAFSGTLQKDKYVVGETFNPAGLTFTATYKKAGEVNVNAAQVTFFAEELDSDGKFISAGEVNIEVSYLGAVAAGTIDVTVTEDEPSEQLLAFVVSGTLEKDKYIIGETFSPAGLIFTAEYKVAGSVPVDLSLVTFTADGLQEGKLIVVGTVQITASFDGMAAERKIEVTVSLEEHLVSFDPNAGGDSVTGMPDPVSVVYGSTFTEPNNRPHRDYYIFGGWYKEAECENAWDFDTDRVRDETTLYAKWTAEEFTVTYNAGEGTVNPESFTYTVESTITLATPTYAHHVFDGWYTAAEGGTAVNAKYLTDNPGSITIYAHWSLDSHTVTFETAGGAAPEAQTAEHGKTVTMPAAPEREGYDFVGWRYGELTLNADETYTVEDDVTFTAVWTAKTYALTFVFVTENVGYTASFIDGYTPPQTYTFDTELTLPTKSVIKIDGVGYEFKGWTLDSNPTTNSVLYTKIAKGQSGAKTYYALISDAESVIFTFDFNYDGAPEPERIEVVTGRKVDASSVTVPDREGYRLIGWYTDRDCSDDKAYNFADGVMKATTVYAKWEHISYTVTFETFGGSAVESKTVYHGDKVSAPTSPNKTGYTFEGWYKDNALTEPFVFDTPIKANTTIYAKWEAIDVTITFKLDGGRPTVEPLTVKFGSALPTLTTPTKTGYDFMGWFDEIGKKWDEGMTLDVTTLTLTASWQVISYKIVYVVTASVNDVSVTAREIDVRYTVYTIENTDFALPTVSGISPAHYVFDGWEKDGKPITQVSVSSFGTGREITLNATYKIKTYTVTFNANGGKLALGTAEKVTVEHGKTVNKPADPTREGWKFVGWNNGNVAYVFTTPVTSDITLTAQWDGEEGTFLYYTTDGTSWNAGKNAEKNGDKNEYAIKDMPLYNNMEFVIVTRKTSGDVYLNAASNLAPGEMKNGILSAEYADDNFKIVNLISSYEGAKFNIYIYYLSDGATVAADGSLNKNATASGISIEPAEIASEKRDPSTSDNSNAITIVNTATAGVTVYIRGTFTDGYGMSDAWSDKSNLLTVIKSGNAFIFRHVYLKKGDAFKVYTPSGDKWYGGNFLGVDNQFALGSTGNEPNIYLGTIENGFYDIVFDTNSKRLTIKTYVAPTIQSIRVSTTKTNYKVGEPFSTSSVTVEITDTDGKTHNNEYRLVGNSTNVAGTITVTVEYTGSLGGESSATFTITVTQIIVSFETGEGASSVDPMKPRFNTAFNLPAAPTKTGYTFRGWNDGKKTYDAGALYNGVLDDATFTAEWEINKYDVKFTVDGEPYGDTVSVEHGQTLAAHKPLDPQKTGYTFRYWTADGSSRYDFNAKVTGPLTLTALWEINKYTVSFTVDGKPYGEALSIEYNKSVGDKKPADPDKFGYTFKHWAADGKEYDFNSAVTDHITLTAVFDVNTYNITYNYACDIEGVEGEAVFQTAHNTYTVEDDFTLDTPTPPAGVTFVAWRLGSAEGAQISKIERGLYAEHLTLYAEYTQNDTVAFTFDYNYPEGAVGNKLENKTDNIVEGLTAVKPSNPTLLSHKFLGWFTSADGGEEYTFTEPVTEPTVVYAHWAINKYTVRFDLNGGSGEIPSSVEVEYGGKVAPVAQPEKLGFTFGGWYSGGKVWSFETDVVTSGVTLVASWTRNEYDITYVLGDGAVNGEGNPDSYNVESETIVLADPVRTGYDFDGWINGDGMPVTEIEKGSTGHVTLTATWSIIEYTVKFTVSGTVNGAAVTGTHEESAIHTVENELALTPVTGVTKGYKFVGWTLGEVDVTEISLGLFESGREITLVANYAIISYSIEYSLGGGQNGDNPNSYVITDGTVTLNDAVMPYHNFLGWYTAADGGDKVTEIDFDFFVDADESVPVTLYAKWAIYTYDVTFNANKPAGAVAEVQNVPAAVKVDHGATVTKPAKEPTLAGYAFLGWYTEKACNNEWVFAGEYGANTVTKSVELFAKWEKRAADGLYVVGTFNGWNTDFVSDENSIYHMVPQSETGEENISGVKYTTKSYVVTGLDLAGSKGGAGRYAEFKIVTYSASTGKVDWHSDDNTSNDWYPSAGDKDCKFDISIVPSGLLGVYLYHNVRNIVVQDYNAEAAMRWTFTYVEKTKTGESAPSKFELVITPDNYNDYREREGTAEGTPNVYLAGNFTGGFALRSEWSDANKDGVITEGKVYTFTEVPLKKYDVFKVVTKSGTNETWLGGTFGSLGTAFTVTQSGADIYLKTIADGLYNIVVDASSSAVKVTIYKAEKVTVSLNKDIYVGETPTANDVDVYASGVKLTSGKFTLIATAAVEGENANTITVKYNGTVVTITYTALPLEITGKALTKNPTRTTYNVGDGISLDGVVVTITYNSGKKVSAEIDDLSFSCEGVTGGKLLTAGDYTVEVLYKGEKVGEYSIKAVNVITSLTVTANDGASLEFVQNAAAPALKNLITVKANYNEDVEGATPVEPTVVTEYTIAAVDMTTVGPQTIKITYNGVEGSIEITIVAPTVTSVEASGSLNKTEYFVGEEFEPDGITFTVRYNNGRSEVVSYEDIEFTSDFIEGTTKFNRSGSKTVSASYNGVAVVGVRLAVEVEDKLTSIKITTNPTKVAYYSGDNIDLDGMVLTGTYNETVPSAVITKVIESGYTTSPSLTDLLTTQDTKITVSFGGFTDEISITVEQLKAVSITVGGTIPEQYLNATLNTTGITVTVKYNSGAEKTFDASSLSGLTFESTAFGEDKTFKQSGTQTVTVRYEEASATFEVNVVNTTKYNVEFFANAPMGTVKGSMPSTQQITHGDRAVDPEADISLTGYTFEGWYTDAACTEKWSFDNAVIANKQLYAKWVGKSYTVTYVVYDGVNGANPDSYTVGEDNLFASVSLKNASKTHYTFDGWYASENFDGAAVTSITYALLEGLDDTITLYAKFSPVSYTVTFIYNDGATSGTVKKVTYDPETGVVEKPTPDPEREGYDFVEWQKDGEAYDFTSIVTGDIVLVAKWEKKTYTITFDYNDGETESTTQLVKYLEKVIRPDDPERENYDFVEWQKDGVTYDFNELVTAEFTLTALWKKVEKVTITFHSNGGTEISPMTIVKGTVATKPTDPERTGYTFDKWYIDEGLDTEYMWNDPVNENIHLYAGWIINKYDVTFDLNYTGAPAATVIKVEYNTAVAQKDIPEDPIREGYEFKGWYTDKNGTTGKEWVSTDLITAAVTVYAKWVKVNMADGIYANGKFVKTIVPNGNSTTEWKVENAILYAGDKITFWRNNAQVTVNVYVRGGLSNNEMSGTSYTNIVVNKSGYFTMYYNPSNNSWENGLWVNYNGEYVAPTLKATDGMYNGSTLVGKFEVNEDGANEIMALDVRLDVKTTLTVQYNGATVTNATLDSGCSLGSASGGKFTLEAGTYSFYYKYSTRIMWIAGTPDEVPADPNAGLTWDTVTTSYGWVVGKFAARSMGSFDWDNGYRMNLNGSEYEIKRLYLTAGDTFKVRAGNYYGSGCNVIRGGTNISNPSDYLKSGSGNDNATVVKTGYYEFYVSNGQNIWFVYSAT